MFSSYQHRDYIRDIQSHRMQRQVTQGSRSRSRSRTRRSVARSRSVPARSLVPSLRYDGEARITRSVDIILDVKQGAGGVPGGFALGTSNYCEALMTFSPLGVTMWGSNVNYSFFGLPNASEIAALWERVKIEKVELTLTSDGTDHVGIGTVPPHQAMSIYLANDINGPTSGSTGDITRVLQESECKRYKVGGNSPAVKWTIRNPKYQRLIQYTSINSSYEPANGYVAADTDIPHYGVRVGIAGAVLVNACHMNVTAKFFFHVKNLH